MSGTQGKKKRKDATSNGTHDPTNPFRMSVERCRPSSVNRSRIDDVADADRGKVLFCAPFRRLQNKAQVFSLERDAAIRSRLTHSLEVSSIGRYIAQSAIELLKGSERQLVDGTARAFITFVETACLAHDLGNPPFGHFGEHAISEWFAKSQKALAEQHLGKRPADAISDVWERHYTDLKNFDGNPQGFRIVTRLQSRLENDRYGLNLSHTQLGTLLKYPWTCEWIAKKGKKKGGYFQTEADIVASVRASLKLGEGQRHPLVYLMEAADDIAYCLSDLEDGIEKGLVHARDFGDTILDRVRAWHDMAKKVTPSVTTPPGDILTALIALADGNQSGLKLPTSGNPKELIDPLADFRSAVIRALVDHAARTFVTNYDKIVDGTFGDLLGEPADAPSTCVEPSLLSWVKDYVAKHIYRSKIVKHREITAHKVVYGLLDAHRELLECSTERFAAILDHRTADALKNKITVESGKISRFPQKYIRAYHSAIQSLTDGSPQSRVLEWAHRAHLLVDYISGMTDEYALSSYQLLSGMRVDLES